MTARRPRRGAPLSACLVQAIYRQHAAEVLTGAPTIKLRSDAKAARKCRYTLGRFGQLANRRVPVNVVRIASVRIGLPGPRQMSLSTSTSTVPGEFELVHPKLRCDHP